MNNELLIVSYEKKNIGEGFYVSCISGLSPSFS